VQAQVRAREGIELARTLGHPFSLAHALFFEAVVLYLVGRGEALLRTLDDVMTLSHEHGFPFWLGLARVFRGATLIDSDPQATVAEIGDGLSQAAATGNQAGAPPMIAMLALAHRAAGQHAEAMQALELALAVSAQTGQPHWDAELHRERGELLLACRADGTADAARGLFERALAIARAQRARSQELRAATSLARLLCAHGARDAARRTLVPIADWFSEGRDSPDVRAAVALLAALG
jgi:predicted ATPase